MTETPERPEGALPTTDDNPDLVAAFDEALDGPAEGTMIGQPLPVGAYADGPPAEPERSIPGLPKAPDSIDEEMAVNHQRLVEDRSDHAQVRPDQASVVDARRGDMVMGFVGPTVREGLLHQIAKASDREREAVREWGRAVRQREEARDVYLAAVAYREQAEEALNTLGLDIEGDHPAVEPTVAAAPVITDDMIR